MSRATRRRWGKRERRRYIDATLQKILKLEREDFSPSAIADHLQLDEGFVRRVLEDFHAFREARRSG